MANSYSLANKRYKRDFAILMCFYVVACFAGPLLISAFPEKPVWMAVLVSILTAAPVIGVFYLTWRLLRETDEYTRARKTEAIVLGAGITFSICMLWGFLELFEVVPNMWTFLVVPMFFASQGIVSCARHLFEKSAA
ncbi:hypothetical protein [Hirschia baltica]|uniref:Transmembrane protein n=1 Tax=Hirschia baltica (strain ATCC 49814 / DSM 5838 / IFAM 1418) TaxID=582402 RepID=C6XMB0_HIRBI|nr:hypothetical protein [Hirschia baltica]ACT58053.1 conserved hypothetical protein [Hirschia baltica ATCC 49814]